MKLKVTQKRIDANKKNGQLGAIAYREKRKALYEANPSFCAHCSTKLPQEKKNNKFFRFSSEVLLEAACA